MGPQRKPLDVGNGLVCASFATDGAWLSMGTPHPHVGLVELTGAAAFPAARDGDVDAVRAHRVGLTEPGSAVLRVLDVRAGGNDGDPAWQLQGDGWSAHAEAFADPGLPTVTQELRVRSDSAGSLTVAFSGRLDRPGYAEITPGGPIPPSLPPTRIAPGAGTLHLTVPDEMTAASVTVASRDLDVGEWQATHAGATASVRWPGPVTQARLSLSVELVSGWSGPSPRQAVRPPRPATGSGLDRIEAAAIRYTLGCTALEVDDQMCCVLTDHRLLPLSWTRDAYYQVALLLSRVDLPDVVGVVERHLAWLWRRGCDGEGVWRRSHLATGAVKDTGYQVDQQLFPVLELVDFRKVLGRFPAGSPSWWGDQVRQVWQGLPRDEGGLVPGEENPADDPAEYPYLLSSQLLLAYTARRLAEYESELGVQDLRLRRDAEEVLGAVRRTFSCAGPFGEQWSYEADGSGGHRLYHDGNDVPTALAPLWGLCDRADPRWIATMRFAFSGHNPGYVAGRLGGLGSAHTPGVWPLGDAQEWAVAVAAGDRSRARAVRDRIELVASADGMLPETYRSDSGVWLARHWFAWPGSLVGLLHATFAGRGPWAGGSGASA